MAKKQKYKRIEDMTDEEWQKRLDEVAGERAEIVEQEPDPRFTEKHNGATPHGGDYSIAYYYDEKHKPCEKAKAKYVNIVIYDKDDKRVNEVYGTLR